MFEATIKNYLDKRAESDPLFAEKYSNESKSIAECCQFICSEVYKSKTAPSEDEVFGWAVHYYDEEEIQFKEVSCKVVVAESESVSAAKIGQKPKSPKKPKKPKKEFTPEEIEEFNNHQLTLFE